MLNARIVTFASALWRGSLTAIGFMAVPLLFKFLPTPALAGNMAARLFTAQAWLSVACGVALLLATKGAAVAGAGRARATLFAVVLGMLLALLIEFAVAPRIVARENLRLWHGAGTLMYAVQWLCASFVLWRLAGSRQE